MTHPDGGETRTMGKAIRRRIPRSSHGDWSTSSDRPDPVLVVEDQNAPRLPWLIPVRRARMAVSPFTFYRGAARIMAADLAAQPTTGLTVQLCGDAHLSNFGVYASPERRLVFDLNDFDETYPGPFEWDVKRLAASFTIAGQDRAFDDDTNRQLAVEATSSYRVTMRRLARLGWLDAWYTHVAFDDLQKMADEEGVSKKRLKRGRRFAAKAKSKDHLQAARQLVEQTSAGPRFLSDPPLLIPFRELPEVAEDVERTRAVIMADLDDYRSSLPRSTRRLLDRYRLVDLAVKVVGVGSVGTRCMVALFLGRVESDVLLLQVKEATTSVIEEHLSERPPGDSGRRVVEGQRLLQAHSDIFLGWSRSSHTPGRHYYWRQLKDWKGSAEIEEMSPKSLTRYARLCGATLARAHAVSGDPQAIAGYLGRGDVFDEAMGDFAVRYADQNLADYEALAQAIRDRRLEAAELQG